MSIDHALGRALAAAVLGRFPPVDGLVDVVPPDAAGACGVVCFTGHAVILTDRPEVVGPFEPDGFGGALAPALLLALAGEGGEIGSIDVVLARPAIGGGTDLTVRTDVDDHPRVVRSRHHRREVRVIGDGRGLVTIGKGLVDRTEISVELTAGPHGAGAGRALVDGALRAIPAGDTVFAQVAAGNAASLRAFLACGFTPIASEVIIEPASGE